ncbi:DUF3054 domain-containing protein [Rhodococcus sp. NPDC057014]|uniref:DUF3054 domain-containing protein n=1 Tax=unclassified Rhodococcus (in: high G+C Gram-positive bacteria) TaxID=192944 RepID=UPI003633D7BF
MKKYLPALALDVVLVIVFCAIGRQSHDETNALTGLATTAWPFLSGLAVGWLATVALYRDKFDAFLIVPTGIVVWLSTLVVGMLLRIVSGRGAEMPFPLIAALSLALFLLGWRALAKIVTKARATT